MADAETEAEWAKSKRIEAEREKARKALETDLAAENKRNSAYLAMDSSHVKGYSRDPQVIMHSAEKFADISLICAAVGLVLAVLNVAATLVSIAYRLGLAGAMLSAVFSIGQLIGFGVGAFFALVSFVSAVYCRIKHGVKITRVLVAVALTTFIIVSYLLAIQLINHLA